MLFRSLVGGVYLNGQIVLGVNELCQDWELFKLLAVGAKAARVGGHIVRQRCAVRQIAGTCLLYTSDEIDIILTQNFNNSYQYVAVAADLLQIAHHHGFNPTILYCCLLYTSSRLFNYRYQIV